MTWLDADGAAVINVAANASPAADLVLLDGATEIAARTLSDLAAVADAEPDAATVTAISNDAGFLSVPRRNLGWPLLPPHLPLAEAAGRVRDGALAIHPRIPTALPHAALIRRFALQLVGPLDEALPLRDALADFGQRAIAAGLAHVAADEVLVAHRGSTSPPPADRWPGPAAVRHPALALAVADAAEDRHSALSRALLAVSVTLEPLRVTIDARNLAGGVTGSTVHAVELLGALEAREDVRVRALLPDRLGDEAARALDGMTTVERLTEAVCESQAVERTHVAHRPWQIEAVADVALLDRLGERTVVTHQDLIGYRTPGVFASSEVWLDYRRTTADALGLAAMVIFFSATAAADAAADDLVAPERSRVVPLGVDPSRLGAGVVERRPDALAAGEGRPFLLVLGNRFRHKNVRFALELLAALRDDHGFDGDLVLAGADVVHGSSTGDEAAWQLAHTEHARHVVELGAVSEAEKAWLLAHAAAVVYPSTYEGFGLVPFEAAAVGTPCLLAPVSALRDTIPRELVLLEPWDPVASADRAVTVLRDGPARDALVGGLRTAAGALTWDRTADGLVAAYRDAVRLPAPPTARLSADLARAEHDYWSVRGGVHDELWELVRPDTPLLDVALGRRMVAVLRGRGGRGRLSAAVRVAGLAGRRKP